MTTHTRRIGDHLVAECANGARCTAAKARSWSPGEINKRVRSYSRGALFAIFKTDEMSVIYRLLTSSRRESER